MLSSCSLLWFCQFPLPPAPRGSTFLHPTNSICYEQTFEMFASSLCAQYICIYLIIIMIDMFSSTGDLDFLSCELCCCCFYLLCLLLDCMLLSKSRLHLYILETTSLINIWLEISYRPCSCSKINMHVFLIKMLYIFN